MIFDPSRPLAPLTNPFGFGDVDFGELMLAAFLAILVFIWRPWIVPLAAKLARKPLGAVIFLAALPVCLRLAILHTHPVPIPDIYDEFGHLLAADTLRHWRFANPAHPFHRFFETFFVIQQPAYASIYPIGNGLILAIGWVIFGLPWAGVLFSVAALCGLSYWMLRGWVSPVWALAGGLLAVFEFGPVVQWTNGYWGGALPAAAGCLVYGALPRIRDRPRVRDALLLGCGLAMHLLTRPYESIFLIVSVLVFLSPLRVWRYTLPALIPVSLACGVTVLHNKQVTGHWMELPYTLSQYQYGVPAALTFQRTPVPHAELTQQQRLDYRMQSNFHPGPETIRDYFDRLAFRVRYYPFYLYPPLYLAFAAFLVTIRSYRWGYVAGTCLLFALGTNFFPAFQYHYLAAVVCLFLLISVRGLQQIAHLRCGKEAARALLFLCVAQFAFRYSIYPQTNAPRRVEVQNRIASIPGKLLVFVRYWPQHIFQDEWVYNGADIDSQRVVWARDLGDAEDTKLKDYYGDRKAMLFEPDARPPRLEPWQAESPAAAPAEPEKPVKHDSKRPLLELEQVK